MSCGLESQPSSPAITCRGSSLTEPAVPASMPFSSAPVTVCPCERITSLRMNGETPTMPGTADTFGITDRHSEKSAEYFSSSACELVPRILRLRSDSNPLITESTTVSAQTPTATPATEIPVITTVAGRLRRCPGCSLASCARWWIHLPTAVSEARTTATVKRMCIGWIRTR